MGRSKQLPPVVDMPLYEEGGYYYTIFIILKIMFNLKIRTLDM